jgi:phosphoglycolate phosphatase-like HAD superfamily hydrolase
MHVSLSDMLSVDLDPDGVSFAGKTDPQILREIVSAAGLVGHELDDAVERGLGLYADRLEATLAPGDVSVLPGVFELIAYLAQKRDVAIGLLTGNLERTAHLKLRLAGLQGQFPFGAFGSDDPVRDRLALIARTRAERFTGANFHPEDIAVVGDTAHDIRCGRVLGAVAVAVCSGLFTRADLEDHNPDVLLDDLSDTDGFLARVFPA